MGGDLFEILFVIAFILFGLLGGRKKKRPQPPRPQPRARQRPAPRPAPDRTATAQRPGAARSGGTGQDRLLRELEGLLTGRPVQREPELESRPVSMEGLPEPDEARSLEALDPEVPSSWEEAKARSADVTDRWRAGRARGAQTLETLEAAGGKSHERFHRLYDRPAEEAEAGGAAFPTGDMRRAIIWAEILGPPVSER